MATKKPTYVEPGSYFSKEALAIFEDKKTTKKTTKKTAKKPAKKSGK